MTPPVIRIENVTRSYLIGKIEVPALRGVSLTVERGEFIAIMGASGSGKSTLMNILGCLDYPDTGHYLLEEVDTAALNEAALARIRGERIGFVFQSFNLLARTNALDNVALPLFYAGRLEETATRVREALVLLGIADREGNHPNQLSGGQQQRVAIARALINHPSILLADEPTGNLDSTTSVEILTTIRRLNREQGLTVVLVTHEAEMAGFADRIIRLRDGLIISDEPTPRANDRETPATLLIVPHPRSPKRARLAWNIYLPFRIAWTAAFIALGRHKLRSALTMLGIFIGVAALIIAVAIGEGARAQIITTFESLGANLLTIYPGGTHSGGARGGMGSAASLTVGDAAAILEEDPAVADVSYSISGAAQLVYGNKNWNTSVEGISPSFVAVNNWSIQEGRGFSEEDNRKGRGVCLLGQEVIRNLFGGSVDPLGATIRVKNVAMQVVGILATKGSVSSPHSPDDVVMIPFNTAERRVLGAAASGGGGGQASVGGAVNTPASFSDKAKVPSLLASSPPNPFGIQPHLTGFVQEIYVQGREREAAKSEAAATLRRRHRIKLKAEDDFFLFDGTEIIQAVDQSRRTMEILLTVIASISLLVGGIGIMNILLVSVTERTREIGIRMAIGAKRLHVLLQFLIEAVLLSTVGGASGVLAGIAISKIITAAAGFPTLLSPLIIMASFLFSACIGIFFLGFIRRDERRVSIRSTPCAMSRTLMERRIGEMSTRPVVRLVKLASACLPCFLAACMVGPDFSRPITNAQRFDLPELPKEEQTAQADQQINYGQSIPARWWELFHSKELSETIDLVLARNASLEGARQSVAAANQSVIIAEAGLLPSIGFGAGYSRGGTFAQPYGSFHNSYSLGPSFNYTPDFFGVTRRGIEGTKASAEGTRYDAVETYLTLTQNVATQALNIAGARLQIATTNEVLAEDEKSLDLVRSKYEGGKAARSDVLAAETALMGDRNALATGRQNLSIARHAMAALASHAPAEWAPPEFDLSMFILPRDLPAIVPSELAHKRPDILAAEAGLHVASAGIGTAIGAKYPSITISGSVATSSAFLDTLLTSTASSWGVNAGASVPIYRGGALEAGKLQAIATYKEQAANYRQIIVNAFQQVADALSALSHDAENMSNLRQSLDISKVSLDLHRESYQVGKASVLDLINAENAYASAREQYAFAQIQQLQDTVTFFIVMGGGWWGNKELFVNRKET